MTGASGTRNTRQRLIAEDGTVVQAEHRPAANGRRDVAIIVIHGFMLHSAHPNVKRVAAWLDGHGPSTRRGDVIPGSHACCDVPAPGKRDRIAPQPTDPGVILLDMRGHGRSAGVSTLGWFEVLDVEAAVGWARALGYRSVVTLGFSLGAAVALRHAALRGGVARVAAVSGPGQWYFRGTPRMRLLHHVVLSAGGRRAARILRRTRISADQWPEPLPMDPVAAASRIAVPLLVVHGERDELFPASHAERIAAAAADGELWVLPEFGHAEGAVDVELACRLKHWLTSGRSR